MCTRQQRSWRLLSEHITLLWSLNEEGGVGLSSTAEKRFTEFIKLINAAAPLQVHQLVFIDEVNYLYCLTESTVFSETPCNLPIRCCCSFFTLKICCWRIGVVCSSISAVDQELFCTRAGFFTERSKNFKIRVLCAGGWCPNSRTGFDVSSQ